MCEGDRELLEAALEAARLAADVHRAAGPLDPARWGEKGTADFVTEVDREAERTIVESLRARFPAHGYLAEEGTVVGWAGAGEEKAPGGSGPLPGGEAAPGGPGGPAVAPGGAAPAPPIRWIIDPLDGTTNWLHGYPEYAVSIAAFDERGLRIGVVVNSATGEEFDAARGAGSRRNGVSILTSELTDPRLALLGTGFPFKKSELLPPYLEMLGRALRCTSGVRRGGAAALDLCALACGRLDAFWETWLMPWDVAAGALIVREAGGAFGPLELKVEATAYPGPPEARATLEAAQAAGRAFVAVCDGEAGWGPPAGGAYMAANAHLFGALTRLLSEP